ncbi:hypothetical protein FI667_g7314, partial [Globisporangium splendens]
MKPRETANADAVYPSFQEPSAPPLSHEQQEREHVPMAKPVFTGGESSPVHVPYIGPSSTGERQGFFRTTLKLIVFHALNASLGSIGFVTVVVGSVLSFALLPLCCLGVLTFRVLLYLVGFLAELDVWLYNFIAPPEQHVYVSIPRRAAVLGISGERLSPKLSSFSPLALSATLYFATVKFALSILSAIVLSITVSMPLDLITDNDPDSRYHDFASFLAFLLVSIVLFIIGASLMPCTASISRRATRYFCCEKFSTYRYVYTEHYPATTGVPSYGTAAAHEQV